MGYGYTVFSKQKSAKDWRVERTYGLKSFADDAVKRFKNQGRLTKIRKN